MIGGTAPEAVQVQLQAAKGTLGPGIS